MGLVILDTSITKGDLIESIKSIHNKKIIYLHTTEFLGEPFNQNDNNKDAHTLISEILKKNNSELFVVFGGHNCIRYDILKNLNIDKVKFLFWPTFLLHYTFYMLKKRYDVLPCYTKNNFEKLYISFNQKPKQHRAIFIDLIHKYNLTEFGEFTWNELLNEWSNNFQFEFWNEKIVRIDLNKDRKDLDVRKDYFTNYMLDNKCLFNIIGESMDNNDGMFITEKTFKSIILGQPFICIGSPFQNIVLKEFGFRLYDDLIDYSFDQESNIFDRVDGLVKNLNKLKFEDLNELYNKIKDIVIHNSKTAFSLIDNDLYMPEELVAFYKDYPEIYKNYSQIDSYMDVGEYFYKIFE